MNGPRGDALRRWLPLVGLGVLVLVAAVLTARPPQGGLPLDPSSTGADGTKAVVLLLEQLGADVATGVAAPSDDTDVALLLRDGLDAPAREAVQSWVRSGGVLVVSDPRSDLSPRRARAQPLTLVDATLAPDCKVAALADVGRVVAAGPATYEVPPGGTGCFRRGDGAWLVVRDEGAGSIVAVGGPAFLTNGGLGEADNAVLAAALLAPRPGTRVDVLTLALPGGGDQRLSDLVPRRVRLALLQLAIAFGVVVAWRARRLGRPVSEPAAVRVPGSELVLAVGNLWQRTAARRRAATALRDDLRHTLRQRLGLGADADDDAVVDAAAARTGAPADALRAALAGRDPAGDAEFVDLARRIESLRAVTLQPGGRHDP